MIKDAQHALVILTHVQLYFAQINALMVLLQMIKDVLLVTVFLVLLLIVPDTVNLDTK
jgi:hypothetical protein